MAKRFRFDAEKGLEAILYLANRLNNPTLHSVSKLLYFADQRHLSEYGRLICGDRYVAMRHGPVPSGVYDVLKWARERSGWHHGLGAAVQNELTIEGYRVRPRRDAHAGAFSESDVEALDWAIAEYGGRSFQQLTTASHDAAWRSADENDLIDLQAIVDQQPNATELREHLEFDP